MKRWIAPALAAAWIAGGCGGAGEGDSSAIGGLKRNVSPAEVERATKSLTKGKTAMLPTASNEFGFKLLNQIAITDASGAVFVSPASISTALAMAYNGAAGGTREAMAKTLGFEGLDLSELNDAEKQTLTVLAAPDPKVTLDIANSMWIQTGFDVKREYIGRVEDSFGAKPTLLDFGSPESPRTINGWVEQATRGKIKDLVEELDKDARMLLINAVYFKGLWQRPFDPQQTEEREFTGLDGKKRKAPFMTLRGDFLFNRADKYDVVRLPYGSGRLGMTVVLPHEGVNVKDVLRGMNSKSWQEQFGKMRTMMGTVSIPKFKQDYTVNLVEPLKALNMSVAFTDQADFTGMRNERDLYIGDVLHKAFIEVNEEGTEAAAATKVEMRVTSAPEIKEFVFVANRPFLYAIEDKETGLIVFLGLLGAVGSPLSGE